MTSNNTRNNRLIPLNQRTPEDARRIQKMGGQVKSLRKSLANSTKNLQHGRYAKKVTIYAQELAGNPKKSGEMCYTLLESLLDKYEDLSLQLQIQVVHLAAKVHSSLHPAKSLSLIGLADADDVSKAVITAFNERKQKNKIRMEEQDE